MSILIRQAKLEDKEQVNQAHIRSIREICSKDYNTDQIQKWSSLKYSDDVWSNTVLHDYCYLVEADSKIHGFCHAKMHSNGIGEIAGMYFTPEIHGKGFGRKLFTKCLADLKQHDPKKIVLTGTKTAKGFYEAMGFKSIEEKVIQIRGADVQCFYMEYVE